MKYNFSNDEELLDFCIHVLGCVDYDTAKNYDEETAEEPDRVEDDRAKLLSDAKSFFKK